MAKTLANTRVTTQKLLTRNSLCKNGLNSTNDGLTLAITVDIAVIVIMTIIMSDNDCDNPFSIYPANWAIGIVNSPSTLIGVINRKIPINDGIINFICSLKENDFIV